MAFRLPPLNAVRLFEAAGRHASIKQAADELALTPGAVSHGVQALEQWLGTPLFERRTRSLALTPAGHAFLADATPILAELAAATAAVPGRRPRGALAISASPSFGLRWLMPRLARFTAANPDLAVTIDTDRRALDLPATGVDLAIRRATAARPGGRWVRLLRETVVPVCAPSLRAAEADPLATAPRLRVTSVQEDWSPWPAAPAHPRDIRIDSMHMALAAAAQGMGVALGCSPVVDDELAAGRLVALAVPRPGAASYWLVGGDGSFERPEVKRFRKWLLAELGG